MFLTKYTEQNYPLLRFLKWTGTIDRHPEVRRRMALRSRAHYELPFLDIRKTEVVNTVASGRLGDVANPANMVRVFFYDSWPELQKAFSARIEIMSRNFLDALERSYDAFLSVDLFKEVEGEFRGTVILPTGQAMCYDFEMRSPQMAEDGILKYGIAGTMLTLDCDGNTLDFAASGDWAYDAKTGGYVERECAESNGPFDFIIVMSLFKKYADVRTVEAKGQSRQYPEKPEVRTTINGITYLDASWYTTIVRTEGFGVRGHFRLQPCGKGRMQKRLIYIHEFQKHGYVRKAKINKLWEEKK